MMIMIVKVPVHLEPRFLVTVVLVVLLVYAWYYGIYNVYL